MTQHTLNGRSEAEVLWFQRRGFLRAAAAWTATSGWAVSASAQAPAARGNIVELAGDVLVNGERARPASVVQSGDRVETGPGSVMTFVIGNSAFHVRQNSRMAVERGNSINAVSVLRLVTGAVVSVWGRSTNRMIVTPTLTAGIRGTGVYTEVFPQQASRSYFCNCYGEVDVTAGVERVRSQAQYHQAFWAEVQPVKGKLLQPARAINHTDEELEALANLVDQRTAWQVAGKKGVKDGVGYMDQQPPTMHPAMPR